MLYIGASNPSSPLRFSGRVDIAAVIIGCAHLRENLQFMKAYLQDLLRGFPGLLQPSQIMVQPGKNGREKFPFLF